VRARRGDSICPALPFGHRVLKTTRHAALFEKNLAAAFKCALECTFLPQAFINRSNFTLCDHLAKGVGFIHSIDWEIFLGVANPRPYCIAERFEDFAAVANRAGRFCLRWVRFPDCPPNPQCTQVTQKLAAHAFRPFAASFCAGTGNESAGVCWLAPFEAVSFGFRNPAGKGVQAAPGLPSSVPRQLWAPLSVVCRACSPGRSLSYRPRLFACETCRRAA
jgi:hypothetical protein